MVALLLLLLLQLLLLQLLLSNLKVKRVDKLQRFNRLRI